MPDIEPGETPSTTITWKPLVSLSHINLRTNDDRFCSPQWASFLCSSLRVPTPFLLGPPQQCPCNAFSYDIFGDHLQTCQPKSAVSQVHDWVVYKMGHHSVPWVIGLRYTKLLRVPVNWQWTRWSWSQRLNSFTKTSSTGQPPTASSHPDSGFQDTQMGI